MTGDVICWFFFSGEILSKWEEENTTLVLFKLVEEGAQLVVPEMDGAVVEGREDPGPGGMEGEALDSVGLCVFHIEMRYSNSKGSMVFKRHTYLGLKLGEHSVGCFWGSVFNF